MPAFRGPLGCERARQDQPLGGRRALRHRRRRDDRPRHGNGALRRDAPRARRHHDARRARPRCRLPPAALRSAEDGQQEGGQPPVLARERGARLLAPRRGAGLRRSTGRAPARARGRRGRLPKRLVRLRARAWRPRRRLVRGRTRDAPRDRRHDRSRKDDAREPPDALLRPDERPDPARRRRSPRIQARRSPQPVRDRAPGAGAVLDDHRREHRLRASRRRGRRRGRRRAGGRCARLHLRAAGGLRHPGGRARRTPVRRRAPADRARPSVPEGCADPDPGRADELGRRANRGADPPSDGAAHDRPHGVHDRAPREHARDLRCAARPRARPRGRHHGPRRHGRSTAPQEAHPVIAKRARRDALLIARTIYESVLPRLPSSALRYLGFVGHEDDEFAWLFIEDAGDDPCSFARHGPLAARWLGTLHGAAAELDLGPSLPERGPGHYLEHLRAGQTRILDNLDNPRLTVSDKSTLRALVSTCELIESTWGSVEAICRDLPRTLVHGDLAGRNVRLRRDDTGPAVVAYDWECSGFGVPASDVYTFAVKATRSDLSRYRETISEYARGVGEEELRALVLVGNGFRLLASVDWATTHLPSPRPEKGVSFLRVYERPLRDWRAALAAAA